MPCYHGLEWELRAPREEAQGAKKCYTYDESLYSLKKAGKRHPTPSEALTLLADHLEGKISGDLKATADDMLYNYGEWLSMAVERQEDMLICYLHPEGLVWDANESRYKKNKFQYESREEFNALLMPSATWIPLDKFSDNFVKLFYGRRFKELPEEMRKGVKKAHIILPANDYVWPVCRDDMSILVKCHNCITKASRGVREKLISEARTTIGDIESASWEDILLAYGTKEGMKQ